MQSLFFRLNLIIMWGFFFFFINNLLWGTFKGKLIPATANTPVFFFFWGPNTLVQLGFFFFLPPLSYEGPLFVEDPGKFDDVLEPGCHCLPWILGQQLAGHLSLRVQQLDLWCETKTKGLLHFFFFLP